MGKKSEEKVIFMLGNKVIAELKQAEKLAGFLGKIEKH
ncbi:hypothetical protein 010DV004_56 [Bacillus phage 010DV004]|nr:hypothetical protein 010DV004_56 [Bacillus phage 010DV004]QZA69273.1 hypothetical protein 010DV005_56 [Bacillus phage 010DV005]QZA69840.1 hypothetical protein 043JT007_54 [Bacillus phage 043JT007]